MPFLIFQRSAFLYNISRYLEIIINVNEAIIK